VSPEERHEQRLKARRDRYGQDVELRERQLQRNRDRRLKQRQAAGPGDGLRRKTFDVAGQPTEFVSLASAAALCGMSKKTFRTLDDSGVIPRNRLIDKVGRRWYPLAFVRWLTPLLSDQSSSRSPHWMLAERVERADAYTGVQATKASAGAQNACGDGDDQCQTAMT